MERVRGGEIERRESASADRHKSCLYLDSKYRARVRWIIFQNT